MEDTQMSSEVEAGGIVAAAVMLPVAVAFGTGWLAWQGGKFLIEANRAVDRQIEEKKNQIEEAARHRKMKAIAAHNQLVDMCSQILSQLEMESSACNILTFAEIEQLKYDLKKICDENIPDDTVRIESLTSLGYLKLDKVVRQQRQIAALKLSDSDAGLYRGLSVADLMDDLRIAIAVMEIHETVGKDITVADPVVLERAKLNKKFENVTDKILHALSFVDSLTTDYGLTISGSTWFHSCFNGIDTLIESLCRPTVSNQELKKGIQRLEAAFEQYEMMAPSIEKEVKKKFALYEIYAEASKALGEKVESIKRFSSSAEIEDRLEYLKKRAEKAQQCAEIYNKLGPAAYLCYAWDQELQAMGYQIHTRKRIMEMAGTKPLHARLGESKLPFYRWDEDELTQLYSITSECSLQVIVHEDGTVSMQTIADDDNGDVVVAQHSHCSQLKALYERLRKNWFVIYNFEETESPDSVTTVAGWRTSKNYAWRDTDREIITDQRAKDKTAEKAKKTQ